MSLNVFLAVFRLRFCQQWHRVELDSVEDQLSVQQRFSQQLIVVHRRHLNMKSSLEQSTACSTNQVSKDELLHQLDGNGIIWIWWHFKKWITISNIRVQHPSYNPSNLANDVAVIRFPENPITLNAFVQTIDLASDVNELFVDALVYVSGFGRFSDSSNQASDVLRFTTKNVITNLACRLRFLTLVQDSTICAIGDPAINNAVCNGDSGKFV